MLKCIKNITKTLGLKNKMEQKEIVLIRNCTYSITLIKDRVVSSLDWLKNYCTTVLLYYIYRSVITIKTDKFGELL